MKDIKVLCPAKVNLYLRVVGRRPDGYHEVVTVMQPLTLADVLTVSLGGEGISLRCDRPELPQGEENLVWRAARRFQEETGLLPGVRLTLAKRIPVAAGLGGGSSDAAGTLLALNELAGKPLADSRLHHLASRLGADVPFFLAREPAVGAAPAPNSVPWPYPLIGTCWLTPGYPSPPAGSMKIWILGPCRGRRRRRPGTRSTLRPGWATIWGRWR